MIPVSSKQEYAKFDMEVRRPGLAFLAQIPRPTSKQFKQHHYWTKALKHLNVAYLSQCAYTTMRLVEGGTVDHYKPKAIFPHLAYEWNNYRLARQKINARKGDSTDIIDPFKVRPGWFVLDMPSCLIRPGSGLDLTTSERIIMTIDILQLNDDDRLVQERCDLLTHLADGDVTMNYLDKQYPFLSSEVRRQGIESRLQTIFSR